MSHCRHRHKCARDAATSAHIDMAARLIQAGWASVRQGASGEGKTPQPASGSSRARSGDEVGRRAGSGGAWLGIAQWDWPGRWQPPGAALLADLGWHGRSVRASAPPPRLPGVARRPRRAAASSAWDGLLPGCLVSPPHLETTWAKSAQRQVYQPKHTGRSPADGVCWFPEGSRWHLAPRHWSGGQPASARSGVRPGVSGWQELDVRRDGVSTVREGE